jgi:HAD superfamily hydrolase (TIGR01490 family)
MSRKFAVFDIDGTLIRWQLYHAVVNQLVRVGQISAEDNEAIRQARMTWKRRSHQDSFRDYEHVLVTTYLAVLNKLTPADYHQAIDQVFEEYKDQVYTYTRDLLRDLKAQNYLLFAISGSHSEIVTKLAEYYGFNASIGATFEQKDGRFTGNTETPFGRKAELLQNMVAEHQADFAGSIAIGDSGSDIAMLELVEQPIAFNPNAELFAKAKAEGWKIVLERKNMVYELEPQTGQKDKHGSYLLA